MLVGSFTALRSAASTSSLVAVSAISAGLMKLVGLLNGCPPFFTNIQREFTLAIKASGVKPIRIHDLRHSHVSNLIAAGVPVPAVAQRIGDNIQQVEKTYAHMMPDSEQFMND